MARTRAKTEADAAKAKDEERERKLKEQLYARERGKFAYDVPGEPSPQGYSARLIMARTRAKEKKGTGQKRRKTEADAAKAKDEERERKLNEQLDALRVEEQKLASKRAKVQGQLADFREEYNEKLLCKLPLELWEKICSSLESNNLFAFALSCRFFRKRQKDLVTKDHKKKLRTEAYGYRSQLVSWRLYGSPRFGQQPKLSASYLEFVMEGALAELGTKHSRDRDYRRDRITLNVMNLCARDGHLDLLKALAAAFLGITLAQVLGVPAGAWLGYTFGWETTLWLTAGLALVALAAILALTPTGLPFQASTLATLGEALTDLRTVLAVSFTVLVMAAVYVFYTYAAPVMEARMGYDREGVSLYLLAFGVGAVFGNLLGGALADRFGSYRTLVFVACAQILFLPFYSFLPAPDAVVFAHAVTWSICGWTFAASQQSRLVALAPGRSNVMLALNAAAIYVGVSLGSWLGGQAIRLYGIDALGLVGSGVAALALIVLVSSERVGR